MHASAHALKMDHRHVFRVFLVGLCDTRDLDLHGDESDRLGRGDWFAHFSVERIGCEEVEGVKVVVVKEADDLGIVISALSIRA